MTDAQQPLPVPPLPAPGAYPVPPVVTSAPVAQGPPGPAQPLAPGATTPGYRAPSPNPNPNPAYRAPAHPLPLPQPPAAQTPFYQTPPFQAPAYQAQPFSAPAFQAPPFQAATFPPPTYQAPTYQAPIYQAPPGAFVGPAGGYAAPFAPAARLTLGPALGRVALILALIATVALTAVAAVLGWQIAQGASAAVDLTALESGDLSFLTPVREIVLWFEITAWSATGLGIWALVQGIAAIAQRRGRGAGIAAVILAALGPIVFTVVVYFVIAAGAASGLIGRAA